jgi:predicted transcriptional regulator
MTPQKSSTKNLTSNKNSFNLNNLSMREFEAFLIFLKHEGEELSVLKKFIDLSFNYTSRTKAYDYINSLVRKGLVYKKTTTEKGKNITRIFIRKQIRKEYEKFILPTIGSIKESLKDVFEEYIDDLKDVEKIREKFRAYTENVILSISNLLENEPVKTINSKRFQKKLYDTIFGYFRAEMLKYEMFAK